ncbi:MAG TPA: SRPBCC domain-containing protein [Methyloceanibacter sp.]|nr:SRPBCC domain-containing protein [Methyloceanibacter sp.]
MSEGKVRPGTKPFEFVISRTFNAPVTRVWRAWTDPDELLHWWGPKGFTIASTKVDLKPGGTFHYLLKSPQGQEMWGRFLYREIVPRKRLVYINSFSDPEGGIARHPMAPDWPLQLFSTIIFEEKDGKTTVTIHWIPYEASDLETETFEKGKDSMQAGWTGTLDRLDSYLARV